MLQYLRISVMPLEKRLCYIIISILVIQNVSMIVVHLNLCSPFEALWNRNLPGAKCLNSTLVYTVTLSLIIFTDFVILLVPAPILKHLTLRWYQKLAIGIVLSFGSLYVSPFIHFRSNFWLTYISLVLASSLFFG